MGHGHVSIRFRHPTRSLAFLSEVLELLPFRTWTIGTPRETPIGTPLSGTYTDSYWITSFAVEPGSGFGSQLTHALDRLLKACAVVHELAKTGGTVELYVTLPGWTNNGDSIDAKTLKTMSDLGVKLSIEVFPE